ncbi:hypothetical protein HCU01_42350 [Halomonas cupida]|uniref:Uncharacterized protein n=1 Tax=Halomonas cupida TaxID=44933 RepID=A0ABQ0WKN6_9GAMM|nr:hypothetical protein [Halomonas cupida]GEN26286.1 hypothetical protein HCU01_42350 [Halomonas cupida]
MTVASFLEVAESFLKMFFSWPAVALFSVFFLRGTISKIADRLIKGESGKAKLGFVEVELGKLAQDGREAVDNINEVSIVLAKSRLLELEVTRDNFSVAFTSEQERELNELISKLREAIEGCQ